MDIVRHCTGSERFEGDGGEVQLGVFSISVEPASVILDNDTKWIRRGERKPKGDPCCTPDVYYSCGAIVDSEAQGIILSPGFPAGYVPGTHCLWQFFIPAGIHLVLEVFDFDVFEDPHNDKTPLGEHSTPALISREVSGSSQNGATEQSRESNNLYPHTKEPVQDGRMKVFFNETNVSNSKAFDGDYSVTQSHEAEGKRMVAQADSAKLEIVQMLPLEQDFSVSESPVDLHKDDSTKLNLSDPLSEFGDYKDVSVDPQFNIERQGEERLGINHLEVQQVNDSAIPTMIPATKVTPFAPPEVCPNDVLYISDLITFSARFCGANTPVNRTLMFGSSQEMVEVVVEMITTTDRGRGFLLLYQFKAGRDADFRTLIKDWDQDNLIHFLVIAGVALLSVVLLTALCRTWRKRAHCKGNHSHCSRTGENGIQNSAVDIGETQLVANGTTREVSTENENNNHSISLEGMGNSLYTEMEMASSESAVTESGSDEIFVISTGLSLGNLHFSSFKTKVAKRSPTTPPAACDWLVPNLPPSEGERLPSVRTAGGRGNSPSRRRAWSARNFHDVLGPLPQLPREWRDWTNNGPFTKLLENFGSSNSPSDLDTDNKRKVVSDMRLETELEQLYSDSSGSAASYPLTQSAQSHRKVLAGTNLRRAWFGSPCFGFRPSTRLHNSSTNWHNRARQQPDPEYVPCGQGPRCSADGSVPNNIIKSLQADATKSRHLANGADRITLTKPVFVISEVSEDRQPLVQALDSAGLSADLGHFEEIKLDKVSRASEQEFNRPQPESNSDL
ncbi:uncharacterized protein LOC144502291 [Mustelus asterias]